MYTPVLFVTFQTNYPYKVKMNKSPASVTNNTTAGVEEPVAEG